MWKFKLNSIYIYINIIYIYNSINLYLIETWKKIYFISCNLYYNLKNEYRKKWIKKRKKDYVKIQTQFLERKFILFPVTFIIKNE